MPRRRPDEETLRARIKQLAERKRRYGYRRVWADLRREGWQVNHKRVHRIWKQEGLSLPRKRPGKRSYGPKGEVKQRATHADHVWTYDLCEDRTERGGRLRLLSVVDEYTRECLAIEVAPSIGGEQVVETLKWLALTRGMPEHIRSDNGAEFIAKKVRGAGGLRDDLHHAREPVGESVYRELHGEAAGRVFELRDLHGPGGGADGDRGVAGGV